MADAPNNQQQAPLDQLSQLIMSRIAPPEAQFDPLNVGAPSPMRVPAMANGVTANVPAGTADLESRVRAPQIPQPAPAAPPPSDDPNITGAQAGLGQSTARLQALMSGYDTAKAGAAAVPQVNPRDYKPKWYDRLLGAGVGFAEGYGKGNEARGAEAGKDATFRLLNRAQADRQRALAPFLTQMQQDRDEIPMVTAANESQWRQFQGAKDVATLNQHQEATDVRADYEKKIADVRQQLADATKDRDSDKQANAMQRLDQMQQEIDRRERQGDQLNDVRQQVADLKEKNSGTGKDKSSLSVGIEAKKQAALAKAHTEYVRATRGLPTDPKATWSEEDKGQLQQAQDAFADASTEALNAYNAEVIAAGGTIAGPQGQGAPAAQPAPAKAAAPTAQAAKPNGNYTPPSPSLWKDKSKGLRVKQPDGTIQLWKLDAGKPTLVSTQTQKGAS